MFWDKASCVDIWWAPLYQELLDWGQLWWATVCLTQSGLIIGFPSLWSVKPPPGARSHRKTLVFTHFLYISLFLLAFLDVYILETNLYTAMDYLLRIVCPQEISDFFDHTFLPVLSSAHDSTHIIQIIESALSYITPYVFFLQ